MENNIDIKTYLEKFAQIEPNYNKDSLESNQQYLAILYRLIYTKVSHLPDEKELRRLKSIYNLLCYTRAIVVPKEIPKYEFDGSKYANDKIEDIYKGKILYVPGIKFSPETFGEMDYWEYVKGLEENKEKLASWTIIEDYNKIQQVKRIMEKEKLSWGQIIDRIKTEKAKDIETKKPKSQ